MKMEQQLRRAILNALRSPLERETQVDKNGYCRLPEQNLLPGVRMEQFVEDLQQGDGNELKMKFCAAHSSTALAINCFAWFRDNSRLSQLSLLGKTGARDLRFERKCPIFTAGTAPHLDVWVEYEQETIAVESKLTEYFKKTQPKFSKAYEGLAPPGLSEPCWWNLYQQSKQSEPSYLDRAQLLKHYFGLRKFQQQERFPGQVTLLYLFWEPTNWIQIEACRAHRREAQEFSEAVAGSQVRFRWMPYAQLWAEWQQVPQLVDDVGKMRTRYQFGVTLPGMAKAGE